MAGEGLRALGSTDILGLIRGFQDIQDAPIRREQQQLSLEQQRNAVQGQRQDLARRKLYGAELDRMEFEGKKLAFGSIKRAESERVANVEHIDGLVEGYVGTPEGKKFITDKNVNLETLKGKERLVGYMQARKSIPSQVDAIRPHLVRAGVEEGTIDSILGSALDLVDKGFAAEGQALITSFTEKHTLSHTESLKASQVNRGGKVTKTQQYQTLSNQMRDALASGDTDTFRGLYNTWQAGVDAPELPNDLQKQAIVNIDGPERSMFLTQQALQGENGGAPDLNSALRFANQALSESVLTSERESARQLKGRVEDLIEARQNIKDNLRITQGVFNVFAGELEGVDASSPQELVDLFLDKSKHKSVGAGGKAVSMRDAMREVGIKEEKVNPMLLRLAEAYKIQKHKADTVELEAGTYLDSIDSDLKPSRLVATAATSPQLRIMDETLHNLKGFEGVETIKDYADPKAPKTYMVSVDGGTAYRMEPKNVQEAPIIDLYSNPFDPSNMGLVAYDIDPATGKVDPASGRAVDAMTEEKLGAGFMSTKNFRTAKNDLISESMGRLKQTVSSSASELSEQQQRSMNMIMQGLELESRKNTAMFSSTEVDAPEQDVNKTSVIQSAEAMYTQIVRATLTLHHFVNN